MVWANRCMVEGRMAAGRSDRGPSPHRRPRARRAGAGGRGRPLSLSLSLALSFVLSLLRARRPGGALEGCCLCQSTGRGSLAWGGAGGGGFFAGAGAAAAPRGQTRSPLSLATPPPPPTHTQPPPLTAPARAPRHYLRPAPAGHRRRRPPPGARTRPVAARRLGGSREVHPGGPAGGLPADGADPARGRRAAARRATRTPLAGRTGAAPHPPVHVPGSLP